MPDGADEASGQHPNETLVEEICFHHELGTVLLLLCASMCRVHAASRILVASLASPAHLERHSTDRHRRRGQGHPAGYLAEPALARDGEINCGGHAREEGGDRLFLPR